MDKREGWLNGWPRMGNNVLLGSAVHCAGCGKFSGVTCVVIPLNWTPPEKDPDWPFEEDTCPICPVSESADDERVQIGSNGMAIRSLRGRLPK